MEIIKGLMQEGGRTVVPAIIRKRLDVEADKEVMWVIDENNISIISRKQALEAARKYFLENKKFEGSIVDELLEDRRREAVRESENV